MNIIYADQHHLDYLLEHDNHISEVMLKRKLAAREVLVVQNDDNSVLGWLRFGYFWDEIPFMNLIYLVKSYRQRGIGRKLVGFWEAEMKAQGHSMVMTSTLSDEQAQHFYRKLGYKDAGSLLLKNEALEILFTKLL